MVRKKGYSVKLSNLSTAIKRILTRNGFLDTAATFRTNISTDTIIRSQQFTPKQDGAFNEYISKELFDIIYNLLLINSLQVISPK